MSDIKARIAMALRHPNYADVFLPKGSAQPVEVQFKVWLIEEAERQGVSSPTIRRWKTMGRFKHLTFRYESAHQVFVSGPHIKLSRLPLKRGKDKMPRRRVNPRRGRWSRTRPHCGGWWEWMENGSSRVEKLLLVPSGREVAGDDAWEQATGKPAGHDGWVENYWESTRTTQKMMPGLWRVFK